MQCYSGIRMPHEEGLFLSAALGTTGVERQRQAEKKAFFHGHFYQHQHQLSESWFTPHFQLLVSAPTCPLSCVRTTLCGALQ